MRWPFVARRIAVLGLGGTGRAVIEALSSLGLDLFLSEKRKLRREEEEFLAERGVPWEEGGHSEAVLERELIIPSPGVPSQEPVLREAVRRGIPVLSEVEVAWRMASPASLFAVTGTNGKSTTTSLIGRILEATGLSPVVAGNIGTPAISTVAETEGRPWVLEVSSYQLEWTEGFRPDVAVFLNFAPDHVDHHGSMGAYFAAKARIFRKLGEADIAVVSRGVLSMLSPKARTVIYERTALPEDWGRDLPRHLLLDLKAAFAACVTFFPEIGSSPLPFEAIEPALRQPHRMEFVGEIRGIPFVNDSKATNAHATAAALEAVPERCVLLLGGRHKGCGYDALEAPIKRKARFAVLFGEAAGFFAELLSEWGVPFAEASSPEEALELAYRNARPGDWVLLSPACASFDQFRNYAHRGDVFKEAFGQLSRRLG